MNLKFKERYSSSNSIINFKLSAIPDGFIPFFMLDFSPISKGRGNYTWHNSASSGLVKKKSYGKYRHTTLMKYISTYNCDYNESKEILELFCSERVFDKYYYNNTTVTRTQIPDYFNNGAPHEYRDIISKFSIGNDAMGVTQGLFGTIRGTNSSTYKITSPLAMLVIKKEAVPLVKLQIIMDKPISFEFFEIWLSDEIFNLSEATRKTIKAYLFDKLDGNIVVKWKSNMNSLTEGYKVPALETLADKREWLVNKELELRNALYGESNTIKTYTIDNSDQMIKDSTHPEVIPKPKKFFVELVD